MARETEPPGTGIDLSEVSEAVSLIGVGVLAAKKLGASAEQTDELSSRLDIAKGVLKVGTTVVGGGAAVVSATGLTVAATSAAGITSGLAAAGGIIGGGMAAGPVAIAIGPAYLGAKAINRALFRDDKAAQFGTNVGAAAGVAGVGAAVVAGGSSGAAIMGTLATVGSVVGGGALAGTLVFAAAPIAVAWACGSAVKRIRKRTT